jgi:hypothetical protein
LRSGPLTDPDGGKEQHVDQGVGALIVCFGYTET